jgi:hypothetical protein
MTAKKKTIEATAPKDGGWAMPAAAKKFHFFVAETGVALCGSWLFTGRVDGDDGDPGVLPRRTDCVKCFRARLSMLGKEGA